MAALEGFIAKFHNLDGLTIGEKQRSFNHLLNENAALLQDENISGAIASKLTPKTHLEALFKVEILLHCRRIPELMEILTTGDEILIRKVIKHSWFFQEAFANLTAEQILNDVLPLLSFSIRVKVLKKISKHLDDEEKVYEIFDAVKHKYGLKMAMPLLLGCKADKIEFVLRNNPVFFTANQLKHFIKKTPGLLPLYVEEYDKHIGNIDFLKKNELLLYIADVDNDLYWRLVNKYRLTIRYGRRMSKKAFENAKDTILADPETYVGVFDTKVYARKLIANRCFKKYFLGKFPKSVESFSYHSVSDQLTLYPKGKRFEFLKECFEEVYKAPLINYPKAITTPILEIIFDPAERVRFADAVVKQSDDVDYVSYQLTSTSIPFLKKEMDLATNKLVRRKQLVHALIKTCKVNDDTASLIEVIKYILARHRNDMEIFDVVFKFVNIYFDLHVFQGDFWGPMNELVDIYEMKKTNFYGITNILLTSFEFTYSNGGSIKEPLWRMLKVNKGTYHIFSYKPKNCRFFQEVIKIIIEVLPSVVDAKHVNSTYCGLVEDILAWNSKHPDFSIVVEDQPRLFEALLEEIRTNKFYSDISGLLCTKHTNDKIMQIIDVYFEKDIRERDIFLYFLKWYPSVIVKNESTFLNSVGRFEAYINKIFTWIKKYEHIDLPQKIIKHYQDESNQKDKVKENTYIFLARLMSSHDYVNSVDKFKPKSLSVDMKQETDKEIYKIQRYILHSYKYVGSPDVLPHILSYCGSDFLRYALGPLYKQCHHVPENKLQSLLKHLVKNAVSVRKHSVFLTFLLCDLNSVRGMLKSSSAIEKNTSLQKRLTLTALKLLQLNVSAESWDIFKYSLTFLDGTDKDAFETLVSVNYIPLDYRLLYFQEIWELMDKNDLLAAHKYELRIKFILKMVDYVKQLPADFCMKIIETLFLNFDDFVLYDYSQINEFIFNFLLNHEKPDRFEKTFIILESRKKSCDFDAKERKKMYLQICAFISNFIMFIINKGPSCGWDNKLLDDFLMKLSKVYEEVEFFKNYLLLLILKIFVNLTEAGVREYASELSCLCQKMVDKYGLYVVSFLESAVVSSLEYFKKPEGEPADSVKKEFIKEFLGAASSEVNYIVSLKVLSFCDKDAPGYGDILDIFKRCTHPIIQVCLRDYGFLTV